MWIVLPLWRARYDELATVDAVRDFTGANGVRFLTRDDSCVAFGAPGVTTAGEIMSALEGQGVAVDRAVSRLHALGPPRF
jgi:hypothetical protein